MNGITKSYEEHQKRLLREIDEDDLFPQLRNETQEAFLKCPRHKFIHRYRLFNETGWSEFADGDEERHYERIYQDQPLVIAGSGSLNYSASNSQPSFILGLIERLEIQKGQNILEIGSGSGWLAAILGSLVGRDGRVTGVEILDDLAQQSVLDINALGLTNVRIRNSNGNIGYPDHSPYDRIIFTAGLIDIHDQIYEQLAEDGLLLAPIRLKGHGDIIHIFSKAGENLQSSEAIDGYFVPLAGQEPDTSFTVARPSDCQWLKKITECPEFSEPFWWGSKTAGEFIQRTAAFRAFLSITEPNTCVIEPDGQEIDSGRDKFAFGLVDYKRRSCLIAKDCKIIGGGPSYKKLKERFKKALCAWVELGMPPGSAFALSVYQHHSMPQSINENTWIERRGCSTFVWRLRGE